LNKHGKGPGVKREKKQGGLRAEVQSVLIHTRKRNFTRRGRNVQARKGKRKKRTCEGTGAEKWHARHGFSGERDGKRGR